MQQTPSTDGNVLLQNWPLQKPKLVEHWQGNEHTLTVKFLSKSEVYPPLQFFKWSVQAGHPETTLAPDWQTCAEKEQSSAPHDGLF